MFSPVLLFSFLFSIFCWVVDLWEGHSKGVRFRAKFRLVRRISQMNPKGRGLGCEEGRRGGGCGWVWVWNGREERGKREGG